MENNQHINNFDTLLKQSLEGAQMPVPQGVWEAVGTSIGTKAVIVAKTASIKLLLIKAVAAVVISGTVVFGVYKLTSKEDQIPQKTDIIEASIQDSQLVSNSESEVPPSEDQSIKTHQSVINDTVHFTNISNFYAVDTTPIASLIIDSSKSNPIAPALTSQADNNQSNPKPITPKIAEPSKKKQVPDATPIIESDNSVNKFSAKDILIPDVFTPYELDGYNDCYKIIIENESKFLLQIFNPAGNKVFETIDKNNCWDGRNMNTAQMCPKGYYVFKLVYELKTGYKKTERGGLNIL